MCFFSQLFHFYWRLTWSLLRHAFHQDFEDFFGHQRAVHEAVGHCCVFLYSALASSKDRDELVV